LISAGLCSRPRCRAHGALLDHLAGFYGVLLLKEGRGKKKGKTGKGRRGGKEGRKNDKRDEREVLLKFIGQKYIWA